MTAPTVVPAPSEARRSAPRLLDYGVMSVPLGFAGTGAAWTAAAGRFGLTPVVGEVLFAISLLGRLAVVIARAPITPTKAAELRDAFRHPVTGPFPAYVPIVALLHTTHYAPHLPQATGQVLAIVWVIVLMLMCGQMIAFWLSGALSLHHIHPGYSLPVIAGPYIASATLTAVGLPGAAMAAFGAGTFFWLAIGSIIIGRLMIAPPLVPQMAPTLSVIVTPPVTGGLAWFAISGGVPDTLQHLLAGVILLLLAVQIFLVPTYVRAPLTMSFWAFSFPVGALTGYAMRWDGAVDTPLSHCLAIGALALATLTIAVLTVMTLVRWWGGRGERRVS